jgi:hypothetical protein
MTALQHANCDLAKANCALGRLELLPRPTIGRTGGLQDEEREMMDRPDRYSTFWKHYLQNHTHPGTRALHYSGTVLAVIGIAFAIATVTPWLALASIAVGYGCAWLGHFLIEHNRPCAFRHPAWSFGSEMRMFGLWLSGALPDELRKAGVPSR